MPDTLHIDGEWPAPLVLSRGWYRAFGRPWNDRGDDASIRLDRGSAAFLALAARHLSDLVPGQVFSPALVASASRIWRKAGFVEHARLDVMERQIGGRLEPGPRPTTLLKRPDVDTLAAIDRHSFEGFWSIGRAGIEESLVAAPTTQVITAGDTDDPVGYAVVGMHMGAAFLQRIAVLPEAEGEGFGQSLLSASIEWASRRGARTMILNVRPGNGRAHDLYERNGFMVSPYQLQVLAFGG